MQAVHPHVAPEAVEAVARTGGACTHGFEYLAGDVQRSAHRDDLGLADSQRHLGTFGGGQRRLGPSGLQTLGGVLGQRHRAAVAQPEFAVALLGE